VAVGAAESGQARSGTLPTEVPRGARGMREPVGGYAGRVCLVHQPSEDETERCRRWRDRRAADTDGTPRDIVMAEPLTGRGSLRKTGAGALNSKRRTPIRADRGGGRFAPCGGHLDVCEASGVIFPSFLRSGRRTNDGGVGSTVTRGPHQRNVVFNSTIASAIYKGFTSPTLGNDLLNGHRVVACNGISNALAMTGNAPTPCPARPN
jgi:hypothetical protein